jgi:predicted regulator of Ras-like GTPase activity (Roadblock/LC7/MglB family)
LAQEGQRHLVQAGAKDAFLELAAGFRRTASLSAKRMGIGAFEEAELSWAQGKVVAAASGPTIILVETDPSARLGTIASAARDFISTSQRRGGSGHA